MTSSEPIAYFITWTVYGAHLQGDENGWRRRRRGEQLPQPQLAKWRRERLKYEVLRLSSDQRAIVERECRRHCEHRRWCLWIAHARSTHVHVVLTAEGCSGRTVRDQLKANATRGLRGQWSQFCDRQVWTVGGDWVCINTEDDLEQVVLYVRDAKTDRVNPNEPDASAFRLMRIGQRVSQPRGGRPRVLELANGTGR